MRPRRSEPLNIARDGADELPAELSYRERVDVLEARLEDLTRLVSDWIWETDSDHNFTFVSARVMDTLGVHPREVIGQNLMSFGAFHPDYGRFGATPSEIERRTTFHDVPYNVPSLQGKVRTIRLSGLPMFEAQTSKFRGYCGTANDITEEIEARTNAAISKGRLMEAIESFPAGFALFDVENRLIICNRAYRSMFAAAAEILVAGVDMFEVFEHCLKAGYFDLPRVVHEAWLEERKLSWSTNSNRYEIAVKTGQWLQVSDRRTADGGMVSNCTDVTVLRQREVALAKAKEEAELSNRPNRNSSPI